MAVPDQAGGYLGRQHEPLQRSQDPGPSQMVQVKVESWQFPTMTVDDIICLSHVSSVKVCMFRMNMSLHNYDNSSAVCLACFRKPRRGGLTLSLYVLQTMRRHRNEVTLELRKVRKSASTHSYNIILRKNKHVVTDLPNLIVCLN